MSGAEPTPLDRAARLVREGEYEVLNPPLVGGRLDEIIAELQTLLWCPKCQTGDFKRCKYRHEKVKVNAAGQKRKVVLRRPCPMVGWDSLLREAKRRG